MAAISVYNFDYRSPGFSKLGWPNKRTSLQRMLYYLKYILRSPYRFCSHSLKSRLMLLFQKPMRNSFFSLHLQGNSPIGWLSNSRSSMSGVVQEILVLYIWNPWKFGPPSFVGFCSAHWLTSLSWRGAAPYELGTAKYFRWKLGFNVKECKSVEIPALHLAPCLCGWSLCRLIGLRGFSWSSPKGSTGWDLVDRLV